MKTQRAGITLVEKIFVIAIMGTLIAILIPAIQYVREISRRTTCQDNLRQIVLGLQHHESARGRLPSLYNGTFLEHPRTPLDEFHFHSWRTAILPELEQTALRDSLDFALPATDMANQSSVNTTIPLFVCPSASNPTSVVPDLAAFNDGSAPTQTLRTAARSDYEAVCGVVFHPSGTRELVQNTKLGAWGEPRRDAAGSLAYRTARLRDVSDGLSNTMLVAERAGRPDLYQKGEPVDPYPYADPTRGTDHHQAAWAISTHFGWLVFWHEQPINQTNKTGVFSFHASGANVGLADGSIRFLSESTAQDTVNALATRASGDVVTLD